MGLIDLEDKTIIITGAASGIGRDTARLAYELGARLLLLDLSPSVSKVAEELGDRCVAKQCDLTDFDNLKTIISEGTAEFNGIFQGFSGLVHCAGISSVVPLRALSNAQYEQVQRVNTQAGLNLAKIISANGMRNKVGQTSIVFISSVYGVVGSASNVAYSISKAAIIGMTKALAVELASKKVRVNCIAPGFIKTEMADKTSKLFSEDYEGVIESMHPLGWGEPRDIANGIVFLLSDAAKWITGTVMNIDGGYTAC